ncbi:MAG TPA: GH1 family beta-glucosidase [Lacisediminihabitans sp.]|uniref:GH1 family beta-glucosidase n=1 Tax=Lacisediminihabitans sp. TaxID=2787631 RepID=UPI002EDA34FA
MTTGTPDFRDSGLRFPDTFIFGAATAAYQIEGAVHEAGRGPSIWDTFSHSPGNVLGGDTGDVADDHFHRLEEDLDLIASLGLDAYRFSIAWPRIQPSGRGPANEAGLEFYGRLVDGLVARGIKPIATLYHWDLPQALEDEGGWRNRRTAYAFADYARIVGRALGDRVHTWTTLNEPWCSAYLGYGSGEHAPGRQSALEAFTAVHHLNLAHGLGVLALREVVPASARMSITLNLHVVRGEAEAARRLDAMGNRAFTWPLLKGVYPADLLADTRTVTDWSFVCPGDLEIVNQPLDVLGVNYYSTSLVRESAASEAQPAGDGASAWPGTGDIEWLEQAGPRTEMGWNVDPSGLVELLESLRDEFPGLALMVTENGAAYTDVVSDNGSSVHDYDRIDFLRRHFTAAHRALESGVNLIGFFVWSLMDNFEWAYGYSKRFGIVRVDYETLERTPKDSALWYKDLIAGRRIP